MSSTLNPEANAFTPQLSAIVVEEGYIHSNKATRASNSFPIGKSYSMFSTFTSFNKIISDMRNNVIALSNEIMKKELPLVNLICHGDDESNTEKVIDVNNRLLDRININIDAMIADKPNKEALGAVNTASWNHAPVVATIKVNGNRASLFGAMNVPRPQIYFKDVIDNSQNVFVPKICMKPNHIKPLAFKILYDQDGHPKEYEHPYYFELQNFHPTASMLDVQNQTITLPTPVKTTRLTYISTESDLDMLVAHLDMVSEIAVDLEHHSYRTFQGFTCLIQISTDEGGDFLIDALLLRDSLHKLNHSFTDPNKLKVFHGAQSDILWLQRDFGVYVVGLFDTFHAARMLKLPRHSLKFLIKHYCDIDVDKRYQLADWRIRPLPEELALYARMDTHYLIYIWRTMRLQLYNQDKTPPHNLIEVFKESRNTCLLIYKKERCTDDSHLTLYLQSHKKFNQAQLTALKMLYKWRDEQARDLDESTNYLLPNHMLMAIAETLPRDIQGLHALCSPMPQFVKLNIVTIHQMVISCRELPEEAAIRCFQSWQNVAGTGWHTPRPHGIHDGGSAHLQYREGKDDTEDLVAIQQYFQNLLDKAVALFSAPKEKCVAQEQDSCLDCNKQMFVPPYDRYRMYRACIKDNEIKSKKEKEARVAAISQGNKLIREEVLTQLKAPPSAATEHKQPSVKVEPPLYVRPTDYSTKGGNTSPSHKRKCGEKKNIVRPTADEKTRDVKTPSKKNTSNRNAGPSRDPNAYKKFYSDNTQRSQGRKQSKSKNK